MKQFYFILFIVAILINGCTKTKPKTGNYVGVFTGTHNENGNTITQERIVELEIIKSDNYYILFRETHNEKNVFLISKDKHDINGILNVSTLSGASIAYSYGPISIDGKWSKDKDQYLLNGTFNYEYTVYNSAESSEESYIVTGTFEITSK